VRPHAVSPPDSPLQHKPTTRFALALAAITMIGSLAVHIFLPVIPVIKAAFAMSEAMAQLTFSIALLAMAIATLAYGFLSDRFGRRPVLLSGLSLFLVGSAVSAAAPSVAVLILGRLIQAVGAGCGVTLVRTIARDAYGPEGLVKAIAYLTMAYSIGPMISPVVGGILLDSFGWRSVFGFSLAAGAAIATAAYLVVYETRPAGGTGAAPRGVLRSYAALFGKARFTAFVVQSGCSTGTFFVAASAASVFMKDHFDRPATEFGLLFFLFPAGYFVGNLISARRGRGAIEAMVLTGALLCFAAVAAESALLLSGQVTPWAFFVPGFFMTMAQGLSLPSAQTGAITAVPELAGTAAGVGVFMQLLGGAGFSQLYGVVADGTVPPLVAVLMSSAMLGVIAGAVTVYLARRKSRPD
jgi:MFS transporter, DHA1 family, multidrug resistance protein